MSLKTNWIEHPVFRVGDTPFQSVVTDHITYDKRVAQLDKPSVWLHAYPDDLGLYATLFCHKKFSAMARMTLYAVPTAGSYVKFYLYRWGLSNIVDAEELVEY